MLAKTAQKHDYPSAAWRRSYARRTGAERGFATAKDPATNDISRGWCRLMGLTPLMLFTTTLLIVRNQRILHAWNTRQEENQRRAAAGLPPKTRKRRRKTLATSPPGRPNPARRHDHEPRARHHHPDSRHDQAKARPDTGQTSGPGHRRGTRRPRHQTMGAPGAGMSDPNVKIGPTET